MARMWRVPQMFSLVGLQIEFRMTETWAGGRMLRGAEAAHLFTFIIIHARLRQHQARSTNTTIFSAAAH